MLKGLEEAGRDDAAADVEDLVGLEPLAEPDDATVADRDVRLATRRTRSVDDETTAEDEVGAHVHHFSGSATTAAGTG